MRANDTNKRRFARLPLRRPAVLDGPHGAVDGTVRDISLNGAKLTVAGAWAGAPKDHYSLTVELAPGATVRMRLSLVHHKGAIAGFQCERLDSISLGHLERLLALYYGDHQGVKREVDLLRQIHHFSG